MKRSKEFRLLMSEISKKRVGILNNRYGKKHSEETKAKMRASALGKKKSLEARENMSKARKGISIVHDKQFKKGMIPWNKGKKMSDQMKEKMKNNLSGKKGELSRNWRGGITPINLLIRTSPEYKEWRKKVFERDKYMCIFGGKEHGKKLHADHILPFHSHIELRFDITNGRTLCESCHRKTDTYGASKKSI